MKTNGTKQLTANTLIKVFVFISDKKVQRNLKRQREEAAVSNTRTSHNPVHWKSPSYITKLFT